MCPQGSNKMTGFLSSLRNQRGQGLIEAGITVAIFTALTMGIVDLGRTFMIANMITNAARDAARSCSMIPSTSSARTNGIISQSSAEWVAIKQQAQTQIKTALDNTQAMALTILPTQSPGAGVVVPPTVPYVTVTVTGSVKYIFKLFGTSFTINRAVTFRDEAR